jgi:hypothetical protein
MIGMPLWSPFAGGWQSSTFVSYEAPAATEEHPLVQMVCGCGAFQRWRYLRHTREPPGILSDPFCKGPRVPTMESVYKVVLVGDDRVWWVRARSSSCHRLKCRTRTDDEPIGATPLEERNPTAPCSPKKCSPRSHASLHPRFAELSERRWQSTALAGSSQGISAWSKPRSTYRPHPMVCVVCSALNGSPPENSATA